jgi:hypothetical protein
MGVVKKSVAFEESVAREALERAGPGGFSRFVNDAVAQRLQAIRIEGLLAEMDERFGPIPPEIMAEVEAEWDEAFGKRGSSASSSTPGR